MGLLTHGVWRSLVACFVRDEEAAGSNPATPTERAPVETAGFRRGASEGGGRNERSELRRPRPIYFLEFLVYFLLCGGCVGGAASAASCGDPDQYISLNSECFSGFVYTAPTPGHH